MLFSVCSTEFLHVHVCLWMSAALPLTRCWDVWKNKIRVVLLRASVRAPCWDRVRIWTPWNLLQKEEWKHEKASRVCLLLKRQTTVFPSLGLCARCALVLLLGRWAAQSRSWGVSDPCAAPLWPDWNLRALQETGVHSLTAASPEVGLSSPPATDQMIRAERSAAWSLSYQKGLNSWVWCVNQVPGDKPHFYV